MKFKWDNEDIENDLKQLEHIAENDIKNKNYYLKIINYTKSILQLQNTKIPRQNKIETILKINSNYYNNERYYDLINIFNNIIKNNQKKIDTTIEKCSKIGNLSIEKYIEDEEALTIMDNFFKNSSGDLYKYFQEQYKNRHNTIKFSFIDPLFDQFGLDGCCTYIDILRKNYILIRNDSGLSKLINLAHECGHAIANLYNPQTVYNRPDEFLTELPSIFFELVFHYETAQEIDSFESALLNIEKIEYFSTLAHNLSKHEQIITEYKKNNYKLDKKLYQNLKEKNKLTKEKINDSINTDIETDGLYVIGYMTALELLSIYKQDKKSALQLLKILIKQGKKDSSEIIIKNIKTFDNIEKELEIIETTMNKEILKKIK